MGIDVGISMDISVGISMGIGIGVGVGIGIGIGVGIRVRPAVAGVARRPVAARVVVPGRVRLRREQAGAQRGQQHERQKDGTSVGVGLSPHGESG